MRRRLLISLFVIAMLVPMSGCPGGASFALGIWLFHVGSSNVYFAIEFFADGTAEGFETGPRPIGASSALSGDLTWQRSGNTITLLQDSSGFVTTFEGTLDGPTFITGTRSNVIDTLSFTATKAPSEILIP